MCLIRSFLILFETNYKTIHSIQNLTTMLTIRKITVEKLDEYQEQILDFRRRYYLQTYPDEPLPDDSNWKEMMVQVYRDFPDFLNYNILQNNQIIADICLFEHPLQTGETQAKIAIFHDKKTESEELFNLICETVNEWKTHSDLAVIHTLQNLVNRVAEYCQFTKGNLLKGLRLNFAEINHNLLNDWAKLLPDNCTYKMIETLNDKEREEVAEAVNTFFQDMKRDDNTVSTHLTVDDILNMEEMAELAMSTYKYLIIKDVNDRLVGLCYTRHRIELPSYAHQMMTGVAPDYRRKGLGKFMKAIMYQHLMQEAPHLKGVETACVVENNKIMGLNEKAGFKVYFDEQQWHYKNSPEG